MRNCQVLFCFINIYKLEGPLGCRLAVISHESTDDVERRERMSSYLSTGISYSEKYFDENFEYRHVIVSGDWVPLVPLDHLMTETEWRNLGIQQSTGWVHYLIHKPERHILLFRRPIALAPRTNRPLEG